MGGHHRILLIVDGLVQLACSALYANICRFVALTFVKMDLHSLFKGDRLDKLTFNDRLV